MHSVQRQGNTKPAPSRISSLAWPIKFGVANRGASIRIPRDTEKSGKGLKNLVVFGQKGICLIHNGNQQNAYRCMMIYENIQYYTSK